MSSGGAGLIRCNQTIRAVIGAAESKHAASTPHGLLGAAESCGEGAAIMVGGGVLTGVWPLVCQGRSGCEGGMGVLVARGQDSDETGSRRSRHSIGGMAKV